jgi:hypothetical protein
MNSERILAGVPPIFSCMIKSPVLTIAAKKISEIRGPVFALGKKRHADQENGPAL